MKLLATVLHIQKQNCGSFGKKGNTELIITTMYRAFFKGIIVATLLFNGIAIGRNAYQLYYIYIGVFYLQ